VTPRRFYAKPTLSFWLIVFFLDMLPLWLMSTFGGWFGLEKLASAARRTLDGLNSIHDSQTGLTFFMQEYYNYQPDEVTRSDGS
jgi:hypothetical protein